MARVNIHPPDALAEQARSAGLNVSNVAKNALRHELANRATSTWVERVRSLPRPRPTVAHATVLEAIDVATEEMVEHCDGEDCAVADSSLVIDFVIETEDAASIEKRIGGFERWAPADIDAEMLSPCRLIEHAVLISTEQADLRRRAAPEVPVRRELLADLLRRARARRPTARLADALHVELTSRLDVPFLTADARLDRAVPTGKGINT